MNVTSNPQAAADEARKEARKNYREMTSPDGSVPEQQCRALTTTRRRSCFL